MIPELLLVFSRQRAIADVSDYEVAHAALRDLILRDPLAHQQRAEKRPWRVGLALTIDEKVDVAAAHGAYAGQRPAASAGALRRDRPIADFIADERHHAIAQGGDEHAAELTRDGRMSHGIDDFNNHVLGIDVVATVRTFPRHECFGRAVVVGDVDAEHATHALALRSL